MRQHQRKVQHQLLQQHRNQLQLNQVIQNLARAHLLQIIIAAIVARDAGAAETAARAHIRNGFLLRSRRRLEAGG